MTTTTTQSTLTLTYNQLRALGDALRAGDEAPYDSGLARSAIAAALELAVAQARTVRVGGDLGAMLLLRDHLESVYWGARDALNYQETEGLAELKGALAMASAHLAGTRPEQVTLLLGEERAANAVWAFELSSLSPPAWLLRPAPPSVEGPCPQAPAQLLAVVQPWLRAYVRACEKLGLWQAWAAYGRLCRLWMPAPVRALSFDEVGEWQQTLCKHLEVLYASEEAQRALAFEAHDRVSTLTENLKAGYALELLVESRDELESVLWVLRNTGAVRKGSLASEFAESLRTSLVQFDAQIDPGAVKRERMQDPPEWLCAVWTDEIYAWWGQLAACGDDEDLTVKFP